MQQGLFDKAKRNLDEHTYAAHSLDEAKELQEKNGGFIKTMWCGDARLRARDEGEGRHVQPLHSASSRSTSDDTCPMCGKPAKHMIYWGVAY